MMIGVRAPRRRIVLLADEKKVNIFDSVGIMDGM